VAEFVEMMGRAKSRGTGAEDDDVHYCQSFCFGPSSTGFKYFYILGDQSLDPIQ
jgi:hypothetical protein